MAIERERRQFLSLGNDLTILGMLGALGTAWATLAAENAQQRERVDNLREQVREIKTDGKEMKANIHLIIRKLDAAEAVRVAERRADRAR